MISLNFRQGVVGGYFWPDHHVGRGVPSAGGDRRLGCAHTGLRQARYKCHDGTSPTPFVTRREGRVSEGHVDPSRCP